MFGRSKVEGQPIDVYPNEPVWVDYLGTRIDGTIVDIRFCVKAGNDTRWFAASEVHFDA